MSVNTQNLDKILRALFEPYRERVADVKKITQSMVAKGLIQDDSEIVNDHIAFRTLGVPHLGIASIEKIFLHYGYKKKSPYFFNKKKLDAFWYEPPYSHYPRIFLSELRVHDLTKKAQDIIYGYTSSIKSDPVDDIDLNDHVKVGNFFNNPLWKLPSKHDYLALLEESEYAGWVIYNRYYLNHYTISVHELTGQYGNLDNFNDFLEFIGITLNTAGGIIKTSKDGLLRQSSSVARIIKAKFANGEELDISGSYVEFAERMVLPEFKSLPKNKLTKEHRRDGFESANADKIFESTYLEQTTKNNK